MSKMDDENFDRRFYDILHLENHDFDDNGNLKQLPKPYGEKKVVVMTFATWCYPCNMTKPEYKKLKEMIDKNKEEVVVACINASGKGTLPSEQKLKDRLKKIFHDFKGFPHIAVFDSNGVLAKTHEGARTAENMMKTIREVK
jgi:thiol-disulfide isomerase/thioredoxin